MNQQDDGLPLMYRGQKSATVPALIVLAIAAAIGVGAYFILQQSPARSSGSMAAASEPTTTLAPSAPEPATTSPVAAVVSSLSPSKHFHKAPTAPESIKLLAPTMLADMRAVNVAWDGKDDTGYANAAIGLSRTWKQMSTAWSEQIVKDPSGWNPYPQFKAISKYVMATTMMASTIVLDTDDPSSESYTAHLKQFDFYVEPGTPGLKHLIELQNAAINGPHNKRIAGLMLTIQPYINADEAERAMIEVVDGNTQ